MQEIELEKIPQLSGSDKVKIYGEFLKRKLELMTGSALSSKMDTKQDIEGGSTTYFYIGEAFYFPRKFDWLIGKKKKLRMIVELSRTYPTDPEDISFIVRYRATIYNNNMKIKIEKILIEQDIFSKEAYSHNIEFMGRLDVVDL